jgi:dTDP-4-amino-4,6-dideoxygalactose transaminase
MSVLATRPSDVARIPFARTEISPEARDAVARVLASEWVTTGPEVAAFEREFAEWVGADHAVAVSSCTAAIELSLRALDLEPGSKVLAPTMTFCGAVNAILHAGLRPVLVDLNLETLMPDATTIEQAVRRSGPVQAMTVLHFAGHPAPVEELAEAAGLSREAVVEDAAHAFGTSVGDRPVGSISAATCFSFYATKNLPIGEGGMVTTSDQRIADHVRRCRLHGMSRDAWMRYLPGSAWRYTVETLGLKANMTDIQAAIGRAQLLHFPRWQARREALATLYDQGLAPVDGVMLPARPSEGHHAWHLYVVRVTDAFPLTRDELISELADRGIDCSVHFIPLHHMPHMRGRAAVSPTDFPGAETVFPRIVSLPLYPSMSEQEVERVCHTIAELGARGPSATPNERRTS